MAKYVGEAYTALMTSDAHFRLWGSRLNAAFAGAGLVQTADTGQINWTTVSRPTAANTIAGYEMWRFDDSLQGSAPIYIKIQYRSLGNASGNSAGVRFTVGQGTDGALTLTGLTSNERIAYYATGTAAYNGTYNRVWACHKDGSFFILTDGWQSSGGGTPSCTFSISRSINMSTGAYNGEGCYIIYVADGPSTNVVTLSQSMNFTSGLLGAATIAGTFPTSDLLNYNTGNKSYVLPHYAAVGAMLSYAPGVLTTTGTAAAGWPTGTEFEAEIQGVTRNYLQFNANTSNSQYFVMNNAFGVTINYGNYANETLFSGAAFVWED
jgi:hypothetical protein